MVDPEKKVKMKRIGKMEPGVTARDLFFPECKLREDLIIKRRQ